MISIAPAGEHDVAELGILLDEMACFYGSAVTDQPERRVARIRAALFGSPAVAGALLARDRQRVVGFAVYSYHWPAREVTSSLFLKELFVLKTHRGRGIGVLLMRQLGQLAMEQECSRIEWMTERWNHPAQRFYYELGARPLSTKIFYRMEGSDIAALAGCPDAGVEAVVDRQRW